MTIKLYTGYGWGLFSHIKYAFYYGVDERVKKLWDEDKWVGIKVRFTTTGERVNY